MDVVGIQNVWITNIPTHQASSTATKQGGNTLGQGPATPGHPGVRSPAGARDVAFFVQGRPDQQCSP